MNERINEKVSVISVYDKAKGGFWPARLRWQGKIRSITKVGLHYTKRQGTKLLHIFSVTDGHLCYNLSFDTEILHWTLLEVADGEPGIKAGLN
jgi:hypothetical protein